MPEQCVSHHRVLLIDQWTPLGAFVQCICGASFFADQTLLDEWYLPFEYKSPRGPEFDVGIFVYSLTVEGR